MFHCIIRQMYL